MRVQNKNNKILKFSIRKLSFGAAPVVIGALIFGSHVPNEVFASDNGVNVNYTYLSENELTESEKNLIKNSVPNDLKNNETYYMVYKKENQNITNETLKTKALPNTGESSLPLAELGLGIAFLVVFLISKKHRNKVLGVVLIGSLGQSVLVPYHSFALENKDLVQYNTKTTITNYSELAKGVIHIDGYRYMGFFTQSDLNDFSQESKINLPKKTKDIAEVESISTKQEKSLTEIEKNENSEQPKIEEEKFNNESGNKNHEIVKSKVKYRTLPEDGVFNVSINKPELKSTNEVIPFEIIKKFDNTIPKGETRVLNEGVNGERIVFSEVSNLDGKETSRVIKTFVTKQVVNKVIAVGTGVSKKGESLVQPEKPEGVVSEKG